MNAVYKQLKAPAYRVNGKHYIRLNSSAVVCVCKYESLWIRISKRFQMTLPNQAVFMSMLPWCKVSLNDICSVRLYVWCVDSLFFVFSFFLCMDNLTSLYPMQWQGIHKLFLCVCLFIVRFKNCVTEWLHPPCWRIEEMLSVPSNLFPRWPAINAFHVDVSNLGIIGAVLVHCPLKFWVNVLVR